jgi:Fic family protein
MGDEKLLCAKADKAKIEAENGIEQVEYVQYQLELGVRDLREMHLLELHKLAVQNIYPCAGSFRSGPVTVGPHTPPDAWQVQNLSGEALDWINGQNGSVSALERAAYALWRFNWIHPIFGGNGRTSRAVAYMIVCLEHGAMLPGQPTMPALIYEHRRRYVQALRAADRAEAEGKPDFSEMVDFLQEMLTRQLAAAIDRLSKPNNSDGH